MREARRPEATIPWHRRRSTPDSAARRKTARACRGSSAPRAGQSSTERPAPPDISETAGLSAKADAETCVWRLSGDVTQRRHLPPAARLHVFRLEAAGFPAAIGDMPLQSGHLR